MACAGKWLPYNPPLLVNVDRHPSRHTFKGPLRMFNLLPKDTVFFDLFEGLANYAIVAAKHLKALAQHFPDIADDTSRIRQAEHSADDLRTRRWIAWTAPLSPHSTGRTFTPW